MTNKEYANEILNVIGDVSIANDAIYQLAYDLYQKLGGEESQVSLDTIYKELKAVIDIWDNTDDLEISENGAYSLLGKNIIVNVSSEQKNNEIWYTSTDGNIVTPYRTSSLPTIVSNTYVDGKGVIKFATDVTSIGGQAFRNCTNLTSITIPNSVISIGSLAFGSCTGLTSVTIPDSVTSIGGSAFSGCTSLPVENNLRYADTYLVAAVDKTLSSYTIKNVTKWIGNSAFENCSGLTSVTIPNSVISIGNSAFEDCRSLTSVTIGNSVTSIGDSAFYECRGLTSVEIPNSVTNIGIYAFYNCRSLTSVTIGNSVTSIGDSAFGYCTGLTSITIPNSVTSIEEDAFDHCTGLTSMNYTGTIAQWNSITKGNNWHYSVPATVVHCSDGDVAI